MNREPNGAQGSRQRELRLVLERERDRVLRASRRLVRDVHEEVAAEKGLVLDVAELSEADVQNDLEFAFLELQGETLARIEAALVQLDEGCYGRCSRCGREISARRLRALPFAARCKACEQAQGERPRRPPVEHQRRRFARLDL